MGRGEGEIKVVIERCMHWKQAVPDACSNGRRANSMRDIWPYGIKIIKIKKVGSGIICPNSLLSHMDCLKLDIHVLVHACTSRYQPVHMNQTKSNSLVITIIFYVLHNHRANCENFDSMFNTVIACCIFLIRTLLIIAFVLSFDVHLFTLSYLFMITFCI